MSLIDRVVPNVKLIEQAITGNYEVHGTIEEADCVIGFSFGYRGDPPNVQPGLSNQDLANVALKYYAHLPAIFQFEIADAYEAAGGTPQNRISQHREAGKYLDTREVAVQAKAIMDTKNWKRAVLLAHPNHAPRADAVCRKLDIDTVVTEDLRGAIEFDPQTTQKWTRDIHAWRGYEPEAIEFYDLKGWL